MFDLLFGFSDCCAIVLVSVLSGDCFGCADCWVCVVICGGDLLFVLLV